MVFFHHQTPLHVAVLTNNLKAVQLLLREGANGNIVDNNGNSVLHFSRTKDTECLEEVLRNRKGLKLNQKNYKGILFVFLISDLIIFLSYK